MERRLPVSSLVLVSFVLITIPTLIQADTVTFALLPQAGISGLPDSTIGWGFSVTNNSALDFYEPSSLEAGSFSNATPELLFDVLGLDLAPGAMATEQFDASTGAGLYQLTWDSGAPLGFTNRGTFTLSGSFFQGDPNNGGTFDVFAPDVSADYSATVAASSVPEPASSGLCLVILAALTVSQLRLRTFKNL